MMGLVLWYNPDPGVGMLWCEDQGPLAFLGPDAARPEGVDELHSGDQIDFTIELRDGVRFVKEINGVTANTSTSDPREIIDAYTREHADEPGLRVVA